MGEKTAISWTDSTWNPWWGCVRVSPGCQNCYAEAQSKRYGWDIWGTLGRRRFFGDAHWNEPLKWNRKAEEAGKRHHVFCGSMCDWAEDRHDLVEPRLRLFELVDNTPWIDWLLLTKRPENILGMIPVKWRLQPPANVWYGTTTENQEYADKRIPLLLQVPARVRFLSAEPLLGPIMLQGDSGPLDSRFYLRSNGGDQRINWLIVGGESGGKARPMHPQWAIDLRDQCTKAGTAFFFKQWGEWAPAYELDAHPDVQARILNSDVKQHEWDTGLGGERLSYRAGKDVTGHLLDGQEWHQFPQ